MYSTYNNNIDNPMHWALFESKVRKFCWRPHTIFPPLTVLFTYKTKIVGYKMEGLVGIQEAAAQQESWCATTPTGPTTDRVNNKFRVFLNQKINKLL